MIEFEFDEVKSQVNLKKHGIDFEAAQQLWNDPDLIQLKVKYSDEPRFLVIGRIAEKFWSAVITFRNKGKNESVRLISVRRSRKKEVALYES